MAYNDCNGNRQFSSQSGNGSGDKPDLKGSLDVAAWWNTDADGNTYLSVKLGDRMKLLPNPEKLSDQKS